jgi:hypothetical protein
MKKIGLLAFLFFNVVIFQMPAPVFSQTDKTAEIRLIDSYARTIDALVKRGKSPHLIFADASDFSGENAKPKWKRFNSEREFEKAREASEFYDIAYVWRQNGKIAAANFTRSSPSGDWVHYVYHYFRPDGSLAKVESELRTFYGNLIVEQDLYFDRRGRILQKNRKFLDLQTQKPKKPEKEFLEGNADFVSRVDYYQRTNRLPFAALLSGKK